MNKEIAIHNHWEFVGYDETELENKNALRFPVEIVVLDSPIEAMALEMAKKMVTRKYYWLKRTYQCKTCGIQEEQLRFMRKADKHMGDED